MHLPLALRCSVLLLGSALLVGNLLGQGAVELPRTAARKEEQKKIDRAQEKVAQHANVDFVGATSFPEKELLTALKEQIASIQGQGLNAARADDAAFFLELFYRKHGFAQANVRYSMPGGNRLRLEIDEGARVIIGTVNFVGNDTLASDKLLEFVLGPTRERYSKAEKRLPYVKSDLDEGIDLVRRLYISEGFLNVIAQEPNVHEAGSNVVDLTIAIVEGQRFYFGDVTFHGNTIYAPEKLRAEIAELLNQPYTDRRLADIPRRLQTFFKARGYYSAKVGATGNPAAARGGRVPVQVILSPGIVYYFDGASATGLQRLHADFLPKRFRSLSGKRYDPKLVDDKFREMMRSGLFSILQIAPEPVEGNKLHLQITAEEAKSKEFGFSLGYGTYAGIIVGASFREHDLFGTGRHLTTSAEYSSRGSKAEILYEDPWLFDTDYHFKLHLSALTFDFDGYSKFEIGMRSDLTRNLTKQYEVGAVVLARHVEVTSATIPTEFLGRTSYQVNSIGFTQSLDLRKSPLVEPRGLVFDNTFDYASSAFSSEIEFVRATARLSYYIPFAPEKKIVDLNPSADEQASGFSHWFRQSLLSFGARVGVIEGLNGSAIPIDERFFNGGSNSVRSFGERDLGPHVGGNPIGGEFFTVFNVEYNFPIFGELQGALFVDAGNLLPSAKQLGLDDMRYGVGVGVRYKLPIGPLRIDYGVNPDRRPEEDFGAFHFSFGFAF